MAGIVWREWTRRMIKNNCWPVCTKQKTTFLHPSRMAFLFLLGLRGYRRTPPASSRRLDLGSTWCLRDRHLYSLAVPDTEVLTVGRGYVEIDRRASSYLSACWSFKTGKCKLRRLQPLGEKKQKKQACYIYFPTAAVRGKFRLLFFLGQILKIKVLDSAFPLE